MGTNQELKDQVIIVTGGASGIGKATAIALNSMGAKLVVADFNMGGAEEVASMLSSTGVEARPYKIDVSKAEEVENMVNWTVKNFGTLTGVFNNAGIGEVKPLLELDPKTYQKVIDINQNGVYYGMYYAAKKMVELKTKGTFINTASIYGIMGASGCFNYNASKAAVIMMSKCAAVDLAPYGIRVNAVAPGFVDTPILGTDEAIKQAYANQQLHKKLIEPKYIASVVAFLFTDGASAITGQTIPIDDGFLVYKS